MRKQLTETVESTQDFYHLSLSELRSRFDEINFDARRAQEESGG